MASLWPWLAIAGAGALHGLNPLGGWMFAVACGVRSRDRSPALWSLIPIAAGHATAIIASAAPGAVMVPLLSRCGTVDASPPPPRGQRRRGLDDARPGSVRRTHRTAMLAVVAAISSALAAAFDAAHPAFSARRRAATA